MNAFESKNAPRTAVFLDRDGTLIEEKGYLHRVEDVVVFPAVGPALRLLKEAGFLLILITNQSGVGRGYFPMSDVESVHRHIQEKLRGDRVEFEKIYIAPEAPDQPSRGRKPSPAFLFDARDELNVDLSRSYVVGDKLIDLQCGWNAGVRKSLLVRTGYGAELERQMPEALGDAVIVEDLREASEWILADAARVGAVTRQRAIESGQ